MPDKPLTTDNSLRGKSALVTGATGFIGTRLVEKLIAEQDVQVTAAVRSVARAEHILSAGARAVDVNLSRSGEVERAVCGNDVVFHLAHDFKRNAAYNLRVFKNLADACAAQGVRRLVYVSSIAVYDQWPAGDLSEDSPSKEIGGDYKNAKMAIEEELRGRVAAQTLDGVILQPTIVYGPMGWMWTDRITEQLTTGTVVLPDDGQGLCNAVYVDDVVDAMILAADGPDLAGEAFIISGAEPVTWRAFFGAYADALGIDAITYADLPPVANGGESAGGGLKALLANPLAIVGWWPVQRVLSGLRALIGDKAIKRLRALIVGLRGRAGPVTHYPSAGDLALYRSKGCCSIDKARRQLGYSPKVDFAAGSGLTGAYIKSKYSGRR